ncbi:thiosulfate dehydrogenase [Flavobacteriaceae bacterium MAR_2010_72]|nr:thiosulfate dehydrogenase [Flavobacteriaceae bacterium MAR_2010_72]
MKLDPIHKDYKVLVLKVCRSSVCVLILGIIITFTYLKVFPVSGSKYEGYVDNVFYMNYEVSTLDNSIQSQNIKLGYELFVNTPKYLGPNNGNPEKAYAGNNLACNNCHLAAGTKPYSAPLIGIIQRFPQFRGRENKIGTIEERINGCFERSMNGRVLPPDSDEMKAFVSYLNYLSRYAPKNGQVIGQGFMDVKIPDRAIDLNHGKQVFETHCVLCHTITGQGEKNPDGITYLYPPLWGDDSFNNGAGMNRVITAAEFIKANMPFGTTFNNIILTDEEIYDVSGYINQMERPVKANLELDFPDLLKKPVSTPYGPYADDFSLEQHQKGPFQPIMAYYKQKYNLNKTK